MRKIDTFRRALLCTLILLLGAIAQSHATYIIVDINGTGQYTSVQAAINAAPVGTSSNADTIYIKDGRYKEKINVPATKPFIVMIGQSVANTILTYDDGASTLVGGVALGTQNSASVSISASDFTAINITFANSFGDGSQAVAVLTNGDRIAFKNCRFLGNQDTLYVKGSGTPKQYFSNCYIDGNVDFVFGSAIAVFDTCVIYGKVKPGITSTYISAPNTPVGQAYGLVYRGCSIAGNTPASYYYLGRPWQAAPNAVYIKPKVVGGMIVPAGWSSNSAGTATLADSYFGEYQSANFNGTLLDVSARVASSVQLTATQAASYTLANMFGTWDPCAIFSCGNFTPTIAMANMKATKGATTFDTIRYNISWPISGVQYQLYRSSDSITYNPLAAQIINAPNDTTWNFQFIDTIPAQGSIYWYYVKATKAGYATNNSDTVKISSAPTILASGTISAFTQYLGSPSAPQTYTLTGTNLTANVVVTAPANYELSVNGGSTYAATASLAPAGGNLAATTVYVRLNATVLGTYSGNVVHTSTGAATLNIPVTGTTIPAPIFTNDTLELWTLGAGNTDSASVRSPGVSPTTPTFSRLYNSTGVSVPAVTAYSYTYGNAFGASSTVDGGWGTANGGPGGNLNRTYYQQFTVKGAPGDSLRVDSLILSSAFYATSSSTKLAVVYSKTGFASDSTDVSGGSGPTGTLPNTANGGFLTPILLAQQNTGPTNTYRLALNGPLGVKTDTAGTITFRLYFSCSSSSPGRFAMVKGVLAVGDYMAFVPCAAPTLVATPTNVSCSTNGSIALATTGGSVPFTYAWTGPNGYTSSVQNPTGLAAGTYNVTVTANGGCTSTATATVAAPVFTTTAVPQSTTTFCAGGSVVLKAGTIATGNTYAWKKNGVAIVPAATDSLYTATTAGSYTVTVTSGSNCIATSPAVVVTVNALPAATITTATPTTFCAGDSVVITTPTVAGNTYVWKLNGTAITGATGHSYAAMATGSYKLFVTNSSGCTDSSVATAVTVNPLPVSTITAGGPVTFCTGGSVQLCASTPLAGNTYQWSLNGTPIAGATNSCITATASGTYCLAVTRTATGCTSSSCQIVTAGAPPTASVTPAGPLAICQGASVTLHTNNATGLTYQWKLNGSNVTTGGTDSTYSLSAAGSYTVVVSAGTGCSSTSAAVVVSVNPLPATAVAASGPLSFCQGDSVKLSAAFAAGNTYAWSNGATGISGANDTAYTAHTSGTYRVVITTASGCKDSSAISTVSVQPLPMPAITYSNGDLSTGTYTAYQWYLNGVAVSGATAATYTPTANGDYTVKVDSGLCANTSAVYTVTGLDVQTVSLNGKPVLVFPNPAHTVVNIQAAAAVNAILKDISGRIVLRAEQTTRLDLSGLSDGVYMLTLTTPDGKLVLNQRIVKTDR